MIMLNRVGCVVTWFTWVRGLRGLASVWVARVKFLRGLRGLRGSKYFLRGSIFFTWVKVFSLSQNLLRFLNVCAGNLFVCECVCMCVCVCLWGGCSWGWVQKIDTFTSSFTWIMTSKFRIFFSSTLRFSRKAKVNYPLAPKGNSEFEIALVKIFSLKQKPNKITATIEKINFCVSRRTASFFLKTKTSSFV